MVLNTGKNSYPRVMGRKQTEINLEMNVGLALCSLLSRTVVLIILDKQNLR